MFRINPDGSNESLNPHEVAQLDQKIAGYQELMGWFLTNMENAQQLLAAGDEAEGARISQEFHDKLVELYEDKYETLNFISHVMGQLYMAADWRIGMMHASLASIRELTPFLPEDLAAAVLHVLPPLEQQDQE